MKIAIGCDHIGLALKPPLVEYLQGLGHTLIDKGTHSTNPTDYPIYGKAVAAAIMAGEADLGIVFCGTGVGISIAANKVAGIRAVVCSEPYTARMSRLHNNTNVLAFGSRVIGVEMAKMIIEQWLGATYEAGRHQPRIELLETYGAGT